MTRPGMAAPGAAAPPRRTPLLALVVATVLTLAGCTGADGDPEEQLTGRITFVTPPDFSFDAQRQWAVECWNHLHPPGQQVDYLQLPPGADDQRAELMSKLQAGYGGYDVVGLDVTWTQEFAKARLIRPLDEVAEQVYGEDFGGHAIDMGRFFDSVLETVRVDGEDWAAPLHTNIGLLYYNTDVIDTEDKKPATWDELAAFLRDPERRDGKAGYIGQFRDYEGLHVNASEVVWAHGGAFIGEDGQVAADEPETIIGLSFLTQGLTEGWIPEEALAYDEQASLHAFRNGEAVFLRHWPYANAQFEAEDSDVRGKFGVMQLPGATQEHGPNALGGANLAISSFGEHPQTAYEFIEFLTSAPIQRRMAARGGYPTALQSAYEGEDPGEAAAIDERCEQDGEQGEQGEAPAAVDRQPDLATLRGALENARSRPTTPYYDHVTTLIQDAVHQVLEDGAGISGHGTAMDTLAKDLRNALRGR